MAQDGCEGRKWRQESAKKGQKAPKWCPDGAQMAPSRAQMVPSWGQNGFLDNANHLSNEIRSSPERNPSIKPRSASGSIATGPELEDLASASMMSTALSSDTPTISTTSRCTVLAYPLLFLPLCSLAQPRLNNQTSDQCPNK